jgi:hypothetical protein
MTLESTPILPCPRCFARPDSPSLHAEPVAGPDGMGTRTVCGLCGSLWTSFASFEPPNLDPSPAESVRRYEDALARSEEAQQAVDDARRRLQLDPGDQAYFSARMRLAFVTPDPGAWVRQLDPPFTVGDAIRAIALRER